MSCLNFIILKVNGIDVSSFPHEEAVQLFLKAQEPIIVEVRRKTPNDVNKLSFFDEPPSSKQLQSITDNKILSSIACQTDISGTTGCGVTIDQQTLEGDDISSPQHCCHSDSQNILNECLAPEIDIEEITLHKSRSDEKLGFTVSYSSGNGSASDTGSDDDDNDDDDDEDDEDTCADIYISDILPDSLAARDGRLRQGDQILQINGRDVSNKDETESLFAENKNPITLLVSRCLYTDDEFLDSAVYCDDKEHNPGQSSCDCEQNTFSSKSSNSENSKNKLQPIVPIDTAVCDHLSHDKIKAQLESVNKEISLLNSQISNMKLQKGTTICSKSSPSTIIKNKKIESLHGTPQGGGINKKSDQRDPPKIPFIPPPFEADNVEHIYETIPEDSETDSYYCSPYESKDQSRVEQWLKSQGCTTTTATATTTATINTSSGTGGGALVRFGISQTAPKNMKDLYLNHIAWNRICKNNSSGDDYENSSSAYNTGGSCNSNPLTFELKTDDKNQSSSTLVFRPYSRQLETVENCKQCQKYRKEKLSPKNKKLLAKTTEVVSATTTTTTTTTITSSTARSHQVGQSLLPSSGANTMYTNVENLHQTIKLQRKLFRKALLRKNSAPQSQVRATIASSTVSSTAGAFVAPSLSQYQFVSSQQEQKTEQMVWKVKRRPDGSRYIVRRPVKNQLLQDRARRINEERNSMTTEDETVSEVKVGRYWTKDERKRHVERSKERRQRQEMLIAAKKNQTTQQWLV